jgi:hypothetical protein
MLSVVHLEAVDLEGCSLPSEQAAALKEHDLEAGILQGNGGTEPREPTTYDRDTHRD